MSYLRTITDSGILVRMFKDKIADTMGVIKKFNWKKERQHYGQNKRKNNELESTTQKTKH